MIDTHTYFKTLREAGFDDRQAEAMTKGITGVVVGSLATKAELLELRVEMNQRFNEVDARFNAIDTRFSGRFTAVDERFNSIDERLTGLEGKLTTGFQRLFAGILGVLGVFIALTTYVGAHVK